MLVAIWIVIFMTTMTGTGTCTANYTEYFRNLAYLSTADKPIGTEMNPSIVHQSNKCRVHQSNRQACCVHQRAALLSILPARQQGPRPRP